MMVQNVSKEIYAESECEWYFHRQVSLVHGISMGGGASLMVPMKFSVVTEKTVSFSYYIHPYVFYFPILL